MVTKEEQKPGEPNKILSSCKNLGAKKDPIMETEEKIPAHVKNLFLKIVSFYRPMFCCRVSPPSAVVNKFGSNLTIIRLKGYSKQ